MKKGADPELPERFAIAVLEELANIRAELIAQRKLLIRLASKLTKQPRRKIKEKAYDDRLVAIDIAKKIRRQVGFKRSDDWKPADEEIGN